MAFVDHIEELRWHIIRALISILIGAIVVFINSSWVFDQIILAPAKDEFISYSALSRLGELVHIDAICMESLKIDFQNTELAG